MKRTASILASLVLMGAMGGASAAAAPMPVFLSPKLHAELHLSPAQDAQWRGIHAQLRDLRHRLKPLRVQLRSAYREEMAKPAPDLARLARLRNHLWAQRHRALVHIQRQALTLYATMTPEQKSLVKTQIAERAARTRAARQAFRAALRHGD